MATIPEAFAVGVQHHQAGRLRAAEQIYRQILQVDPYHVDALHLLGFLYHQAGQHTLGVDYLQQAILLRGNQAPFHHNLGDAYRALGRLADAVACYKRALQLKPDLMESHNNLGLTYQQQGLLDQAASCFERVLELTPNDVDGHNNLANVYLNQGRNAEAISTLRRVLAERPGDATLHNKLGVALKKLGQLDEAVASYQHALQLKPDFFEAHYNLGIALHAQGKFEEAMASYRQALWFNPNFADAVCNLGLVLKEQGNLDEAIAHFQKALELQPESTAAYTGLGSALKAQGKLDEAIACYQKALQLQPSSFETLLNLGNALAYQGHLPQAIASFQDALKLKPNDQALLALLIHQLQHACLWQDLTKLSRQVIEGVSGSTNGEKVGVDPFAFLTLPIPTSAAQQLHCARMWLKETPQIANPMERPLPLPPRRPGKNKITLGYLSADYRQHAVAFLIAELFELHDRARFEVFGYSYGRDDGSPLRRRLAGAFDRFIDLRNVSHLESAQRIAADEVDILIDLTGYTTDARPAIMAWRPAPIQVNYLGYPGTMGAPFMDYIIVDDFIVPSDYQSFYTEKLVHLPCYQVNDSKREISPHTPTRAECGLPAEGFVFCDFNNTFKINPGMFEVWLDLLKAVPGSVLWLYEANRYASANLRREAAERGVVPERLVFAPKRPLPDHLARHRLADLFLDTFPYGGLTTASDALWAGCPLLTLAGETFASRVAGSLLRTIGLPELITTSLDEYKAMALRLARNPDLLAELRARLSANRVTSGLFDSARFTRNLEAAYNVMWKIYSEGEKPRSFSVPDIHA